MSEAIQDAISALEDERTVIDQQIAAVRDAVLEQIDTAIETLRAIGGGAARKGKPKKPAAAKRPKAATATRAAQTGGRAEVAQARDAAIKAALRKGPTASADLLAVLPKEPGQTAEQRQDALRNALSRMRIRKEIESVDEGWALA